MRSDNVEQKLHKGFTLMASNIKRNSGSPTINDQSYYYASQLQKDFLVVNQVTNAEGLKDRRREGLKRLNQHKSKSHQFIQSPYQSVGQPKELASRVLASKTQIQDKNTIMPNQIGDVVMSVGEHQSDLSSCNDYDQSSEMAECQLTVSGSGNINMN